MSARKFCTRIHAYDSTGRKVCPYTGVRGKKTGLYSVNFTTDNKKFEGRSNCQYRNRCIRGCPFGAYFSSNSSTLPAAERTKNMTL